MSPTDFLKFGELGVIFAALVGAFLLLRELPVRIGREVGDAVGRAILESEGRTAARINDVEVAMRGICRLSHTPPPPPPEESTPPLRFPRHGRLPLDSSSG